MLLLFENTIMRSIAVIAILFLFCAEVIGQRHQNVFDAQSLEQGVISPEQAKIIFKSAKTFPNGSEFSIAIIRRNKKPEFYGIRKENDTVNTVINKKSIFEIGSISKTFTATLLADLSVNGKLNLNDPLKDFVDLGENDSLGITLTHLANHTSGLPRLPSNLILWFADPKNPYKNYGEKDLKNYLAGKIELTTKPGEKSAYSNLGFGLLGYVLTTKENKTYEELLTKTIFKKYGMPNTTTDRNKVKADLVAGRDPSGEIVPNWDLNVMEGAGAILSNVVDLSKYVTAHFNPSDRVLSLTRKPTFRIKSDMEIALSWFVLDKGELGKWIWHNGGTGGYSSSLALSPENEYGVVVLTNVSAFHPNRGSIEDVCFGLMKSIGENDKIK
ncbi:hypothetical protein FUAX_47710 (plasmid) [Fulvitalea axinellae]|uniref:Beta-lactamase n=1 Tax=Fulvitalea axinellae TaxID=1182444 RepID=A0AAU9D0V8_9BACT|nr:hypothetical protein FUAX_47710 [Fulvitalea axinellae]